MTQQEALASARKYVAEQCAIMAKFGTPTKATADELERAAVTCAKYAMKANRVKWDSIAYLAERTHLIASAGTR